MRPPAVARIKLGVRSVDRLDRTLAGHPGSGRQATDRGAAAVEMALVLPLLLVLIFGIIDFGRMLNKQIALTEAARDAARVASFGGDPTARATRIAGDDVTVTVTGSCSGPGRDAEVTVTNDFSFVTPVGLIGGGLDGEVTLTGTGVVPCQ